MKCLFTLLASLTLPLLAADDEPLTYKLNQVNWGEAITGAAKTELKPADLEGKVVVVEEFGVLTEACLQRLKELGRIRKKLDRDKSNAVIIAIHRQRQVADEKIVEAVEDERAEEIIIRKNGFLPASIGGMPHAAIFLPDGRMLWHGDSTERDFEKKLDEALEAAGESSP